MAIMTLAALAAALWGASSVNPLRGDSAEYLYFDRSRSVGYPAFIELVRLATGRVALGVPIQMTVLAASLLTLGISFYRLTGRPAWAIIFTAALALQPGMWFASAFLMTEALSTALVALWAAWLLRMARAPSTSDVLVLTIIAGVATLVRPPLVALFAANALLAMGSLCGRERWRALTIMGAGLFFSWAATPAAQWFVHGTSNTTSPFARGVLQHTLYCEIGATPHSPDSAFVEQVSGPVRRYIATAPLDVREQLRREYSTPLRFGLIIPALGRQHGVDRRSAVDPYLQPIASERVAANPFCYVSSVLGEYARMAVFDTDPSAEEGRRVRSFAAAHPPIELAQLPVLAGDEQLARRSGIEVGNKPSGLNPPRYHLNVVAKVPFIALLPFRLIFGAATLIGVFALFARGKADQPELAPMAAMGAAFHGVLLITAIVEIGFFRYLVPLWPLVCALIALGLITIFSRKAPTRAKHEP